MTLETFRPLCFGSQTLGARVSLGDRGKPKEPNKLTSLKMASCPLAGPADLTCLQGKCRVSVLALEHAR